MTPEQIALRDAFLAECWKPCREESREDRAVKRALDAAYQPPDMHRDLHKYTATKDAGTDMECA